MRSSKGAAEASILSGRLPGDLVADSNLATAILGAGRAHIMEPADPRSRDSGLGRSGRLLELSYATQRFAGREGSASGHRSRRLMDRNACMEQVDVATF
jgi:hypothetical protein